MDLRQLSSFMAVAEELHFGRAAERLHISQPPLSRQIMDLEEELEARLFERTPKGVELTPAGAYLKIEASKLLSAATSIQELIRKIGGSGTRRVRIGYVGSAMQSFLPELVGVFRKRLPQLSYEFVEMGSDEQGKALRTGKIDLAFLRSWQRESGIHFISLFEESLFIARARDFPGPEGDCAELASYRELPYIAFSKTCAPGIAERAKGACERAGFVPHAVFTANDFDTALRLIVAGLGWSIIPSLTLRNPPLDVLVSEIAGLPEHIAMGMATRGDEGDRIVHELLEISLEWFSGAGYPPSSEA